VSGRLARDPARRGRQRLTSKGLRVYSRRKTAL
jgi:hypothetical protein